MLVRSVSVDVDPNAPKKIQNFPFCFGRLPQVLPARENRISTQGSDRKLLGKVNSLRGVVLVCTGPSALSMHMCPFTAMHCTAQLGMTSAWLFLWLLLKGQYASSVHFTAVPSDMGCRLKNLIAVPLPLQPSSSNSWDLPWCFQGRRASCACARCTLGA